MKFKFYYTIIVGVVFVVFISLNASAFFSSSHKEKDLPRIKGAQNTRYLLDFDSDPVEKATPTPLETLIPTQAEVETINSDTFNSSPLDEINEYRISKGLLSINVLDEVCAFAQLRVQELQSDFSHNGFSARQDGNTLPYSSFQTVVENIANAPSGNAVELWKGSTLHEENLRADIEFGCVKETNGFYVFEGMKR